MFQGKMNIQMKMFILNRIIYDVINQTIDAIIQTPKILMK